MNVVVSRALLRVPPQTYQQRRGTIGVTLKRWSGIHMYTDGVKRAAAAEPWRLGDVQRSGCACWRSTAG